MPTLLAFMAAQFASVRDVQVLMNRSLCTNQQVVALIFKQWLEATYFLLNLSESH